MDLDETVQWYRDKLDFRVVSDLTRVQARTVVLERSGFLLEISEDERLTAAPLSAASDVGVTGSTGIPTADVLVSDVDAEIDQLRSRGVDIVAEPQDELDGRSRVAFIRDNGGRIVELREPLGSGADFPADGR
jgi:catechol 2,3-dioxygenase-like lactoylglutathione lyase family enzyme